MKAIVKAEKREGFTYQDLPDPVVGPDDVLVKVDSATVCGSDVMFYHWYPAIRWMVTEPPFVPGHEGSGTVVEVGRDVKNIKRAIAWQSRRTCRAEGVSSAEPENSISAGT